MILAMKSIGFWVYRSSLLIAIEMTLAATFSLLLGSWLGHYLKIDQVIVGGLWSVISTILVIQATNQEAFSAAWLRILGSLIGAILAGILVGAFSYHLWVFSVGIFISVIICALAKLNNAMRLSCITFAIILVIGELTPQMNPWLNSAGRFLESLVGVIIALIIALPLKPVRKKLRLAYELNTK